MDENIIVAIRQLERDYLTVYPYQVAMVVHLSERMTRYKMVQLAECGALQRLGERKGYITRTRYEARFLFAVNWGVGGV